MSLLHKHKSAIPEQPAALTSESSIFDGDLQKIVDAYSPVGEDKYLQTKTHRGPKSLYLFEDQGTPHAKNFVCKNGDTTTLYRLQSELVDESNEAGIRQYSITEKPGLALQVTSQFFSRKVAREASFGIPEGQFVKEFDEDAGPRAAETHEIVTWLEQYSGLLTPEQKQEMALVGFALSVVGPHPGASKEPLTS